MASAHLFDLTLPLRLIYRRLPLPMRAWLRSRGTAFSGWTSDRLFPKNQRALKALIAPRYLAAPAPSHKHIKVPS